MVKKKKSVATPISARPPGGAYCHFVIPVLISNYGLLALLELSGNELCVTLGLCGVGGELTSSLLHFSVAVGFVMTAKPALSRGPSGTQGGQPEFLPPQS